MKIRLDAIDWHILNELQSDGRITNVELARRVGISAPPCLRRVRALEEAGLIIGYRTLLDEKQLGYDVTAFAMVAASTFGTLLVPLAAATGAGCVGRIKAPVPWLRRQRV